jgi:chromosome segregation ATPase
MSEVIDRRTGKPAICARPNCGENECRVNGYCSNYCEDIHALQQQLSEAQRERDEAKAQLKREERDCGKVIDERDEYVESLNELFHELGMTEEDSTWSNLNNPVERAKEYIWAAEKELSEANAQAAAYRSMMGTLLFEMVGAGLNETSHQRMAAQMLNDGTAGRELLADCERMREALKKIADYRKCHGCDGGLCMACNLLAIAEHALKGGGE